MNIFIRIFIAISLSILLISQANASSASGGYNRTTIFNQVKKAIKSPKGPGIPNIPVTIIGLGIGGLIEGIEAIQKDMESPNRIPSSSDAYGVNNSACRNYDTSRVEYYVSTARKSNKSVSYEIFGSGKTVSLRIFLDGNHVYTYVIPCLDTTTSDSDKKSGTTTPNMTEQDLDKAINDLINKYEDDIKRAIDKQSSSSTTNTTTNTNTTTDTKPADVTQPFELPAFCGWAKPVCDLFDFVKVGLTDIKTSINDFIDWVKQEPTDKPQDIEIPQKEIVLKNPAEFDKRYIAVNSQCPADVVKDFDTGFKKEQVTISFEPICSTIYDYFRPVIIFLAYIGAIFVISSAFKIG